MTADEAIAEVKSKKADRLSGQWIGEILVVEIERLRKPKPMTAVHPVCDAMRIIKEHDEIFARMTIGKGPTPAYFRVTKVDAIKTLMDRLHWIDGVRMHVTENAVHIEGLE